MVKVRELTEQICGNDELGIYSVHHEINKYAHVSIFSHLEPEAIRIITGVAY